MSVKTHVKLFQNGEKQDSMLGSIKVNKPMLEHAVFCTGQQCNLRECFIPQEYLDNMMDEWPAYLMRGQIFLYIDLL